MGECCETIIDIIELLAELALAVWILFLFVAANAYARFAVIFYSGTFSVSNAVVVGGHRTVLSQILSYKFESDPYLKFHVQNLGISPPETRGRKTAYLLVDLRRFAITIADCSPNAAILLATEPSRSLPPMTSLKRHLLLSKCCFLFHQVVHTHSTRRCWQFYYESMRHLFSIKTTQKIIARVAVKSAYTVPPFYGL